MCGVCGGGGRQSWYTAGVLDTAAGRMRSAARLAEAVRRSLAGTGATIRMVPAAKDFAIVAPSGGLHVIDGVPAAVDALAAIAPGARR